MASSGNSFMALPSLKTIILPTRNEADLEDLPEEVRDQINFVFAETVEDVLEAAMGPLDSANTQNETTK